LSILFWLPQKFWWRFAVALSHGSPQSYWFMKHMFLRILSLLLRFWTCFIKSNCMNRIYNCQRFFLKNEVSNLIPPPQTQYSQRMWQFSSQNLSLIWDYRTQSPWSRWFGLFTFNSSKININVYEVNGIQDPIWHNSFNSIIRDVCHNGPKPVSSIYA